MNQETLPQHRNTHNHVLHSGMEQTTLADQATMDHEHAMTSTPHVEGIIMDSVVLMTAIDVIIVALTLFAVWSFYQHRKILAQLGASGSVLLCLGGLFIMSMFYLADMGAMFVLPQFIPMSEAMQIMNNLHLNYKWMVTVLAVGMIVISVIYLIKILLPKIGALLEQHKSYQKDLEREVTERTTELTLAVQDARHANEVKNYFLSQMSHELRTPLNAIIGYCELILENDDDKPLTTSQQGDMNKILGSGQHLLNLIDDLLDLSRIELGNIDLHMQAVNLQNTFKDCMHIVKQLAAKRQITLHNQLDENEDYMLYADDRRLKQVIINFFTNAIKYNHEGGSVSIRCAPTANDRLRISVTDTGEGIAPEKHLRIFNAFDRLNKGSGIEGTGIGLTVTKHLVEAMQGSIGLESAPGKGSTFWFELARAEAQTQDKAASSF